MQTEFSKQTKREAWLRCHDERGEARCESCAEAFWGSVVILYGMTKDRWRWGEFARSGGQIFIGLIIGFVVIMILTAIAQQFGR